MNPRSFITAALGGLVCSSALAAQPAAAPAGPWAKVPALPTACYASQDDWFDRNEAALAAVQEDHSRQDDINTESKNKALEAFNEDPMAIAQAMTQTMLNDPQDAQKNMERMVQQGQQAGTDVQEDSARAQQLEAESKTIVKQYEAALLKAMQPAQARWNAFQKRMGWEVGPGFAMMPDPSWSDAAWQEWAAVQKMRDAAYTANCAQWWAATGPMHAYMKRYKDYLLQEYIPHMKRLVDDPALDQFKMLDVPATGYRTVADYEAAELYMRRAYTMFSQREAKPYCGADGGCSI
jgi:hypothetical protein